MGRIIKAFQVFFKVLTGSVPTEQVENLLALPRPAASDENSAEASGKQPSTAPPKPARSEAITLLAALQREARFIDLVQEPLAEYSDEEIGAAARNVLRDTREALSRMIQIVPVVDAEDGTEFETPSQFDAGVFHLTGNVSGEPPFKGRLTHHGWRASTCNIPTWTGTAASADIIAPAEIEIE